MTGGESDRRVLVLSQRKLETSPAYAALYEFEDFVLSVEDSDLVELQSTIGNRRFDLGRYTYKALRTAGATERTAGRLAPDLCSVVIEEEFDLVLAVLTSWYDLYSLRQVKGIENVPLVCWISEVWPSDLMVRAAVLEPLERLDRIFLGTRASIEPVSDLARQAVEYLPYGIDVLAFGSDWRAERTIGAVNIGRRDPGVDDALRSASVSGGWRYDTETASVDGHRESRKSLSRLLGRSESYVVNHAKFNLPGVIGSNVEIPGRFFEAIASGAVPVGSLGLLDHPSLDGMEACLGVNASDPRAVVSAVEMIRTDHEEANARRLLGFQAAARSHDWGHRWKTILDSVALSPTDAHQRRLDELSGQGRSTLKIA